VAIIPYAFDAQRVGQIARHADNLVFMKGAQQLKELVPILKNSGFTEDSTVAIVQRCTMPEENVMIGRLGDVKDWNINGEYFSMTIIKKSKLQRNLIKNDVL
jgi:siroheme synthase